MDKPLFNADAAEEYFTSLCTYYRDTRNDILKRDNEGRHASEQVYSAEYQKFLGMELAMREVLEYFSKFDLGPADGEPLTLEELRSMDGQPVWIVAWPDWGHWELSENAEDYLEDRDPDFYGMKYDDPAGKYGLHVSGWLAYRRPPVKEEQ